MENQEFNTNPTNSQKPKDKSDLMNTYLFYFMWIGIIGTTFKLITTMLSGIAWLRGDFFTGGRIFYVICVITSIGGLYMCTKVKKIGAFLFFCFGILSGITYSFLEPSGTGVIFAGYIGWALLFFLQKNGVSFWKLILGDD